MITIILGIKKVFTDFFSPVLDVFCSFMATMFRHEEKNLICATTKVSNIFSVAEVSYGEFYRRWSEGHKNQLFLSLNLILYLIPELWNQLNYTEIQLYSFH